MEAPPDPTPEMMHQLYAQLLAYQQQYQQAVTEREWYRVRAEQAEARLEGMAPPLMKACTGLESTLGRLAHAKTLEDLSDMSRALYESRAIIISLTDSADPNLPDRTHEGLKRPLNCAHRAASGTEAGRGRPEKLPSIGAAAAATSNVAQRASAARPRREAGGSASDKARPSRVPVPNARAGRGPAGQGRGASCARGQSPAESLLASGGAGSPGPPGAWPGGVPAGSLPPGFGPGCSFSQPYGWGA